MLITATNLTAGHATDSGSDSLSTATTASISPNNNQLILVYVGIKRFGGVPGTPTISGLGLTWVQVGSVTSASGNLRGTLFRGMGSPTSGTITVTPNEACGNIYWTVDQLANVKTTGTNGSDAVVQSATGTTGSTSLSISLSAFGNYFNASYGVIYIDATSGISLTPGSNFTQLAVSSSGHIIESEWANNNQTTISWSWTGSADAVGIGVEIGAQPDAGITSDI